MPSPATNSDYECVELIYVGVASNIRPTVHLVFSPFLQENTQLNLFLLLLFRKKS